MMFAVAQHRRDRGYRHYASRKNWLFDQRVQQSRFATFELPNAGDEEAAFADSGNELMGIRGNRALTQLLGNLRKACESPGVNRTYI